MSDRLLLADFEPHIGTTFKLSAASENECFNVVLVSGKELASGPQPHMPDVSFSVVFRGPLEPKLPQMISVLEHHEMGTLDLFLVPFQEDEAGRYYEATYSYLD